MQQAVSEAWLKKQGVVVSSGKLQELIAKTQAEWEMRVGLVLADKLSEEQLAEFERIYDNEPEDASIDYLNFIYPEYPKIVARKKRELRREIREAPDKVAVIESWSRK